ncbi:hypothetical protein AALT_g10905 [Alternaria alternata]|nr:hypothetical protein AALT_g10905 [Alternaria alternata]
MVTLSYCALNSHPHYRTYPGLDLAQYHKGTPFGQLKQQYSQTPPSPQSSKRRTPGDVTASRDSQHSARENPLPSLLKPCER